MTAKHLKTLNIIVKKYNLKVGRREHIVEIPNMGREQLAHLFAELKFKVGAEIGVEKGVYSEILLKVNPKLFLYSIDPYSHSAYDPKIIGINYNKAHYDRCYKMAKGKLSKYKCEIIRKESIMAVKDFKDSSLDFVYIDGNHNFVNVTNDIHEWSKKVKVGGIISGHDFAYSPSWKHNHVKHVVLAYTKAYGIKPLFIVGAQPVRQPGIVRDRFRSWFWIKS